MRDMRKHVGKAVRSPAVFPQLNERIPQNYEFYIDIVKKQDIIKLNNVQNNVQFDFAR